MKRIALAFALVFSISTWAQMEGITVTGTVVREVESDEMILRFSVSSLADEVDDAFIQNEEKSARIIAYFEDLDNGSELETEHVVLRENRQYRNGRSYREGFIASQSFTLVIVQFEDYPSIVKELIRLGVENLSSGQFRYSKAESIRNEMRVECIEEAKRKATQVAEGLGVELGSAVGFTEYNPSSNIGYANARYMEDAIQVAGNGSGPSVAPGNQSVSMTVTVRFAILAPQTQE